jgi:hypothetical protein
MTPSTLAKEDKVMNELNREVISMFLIMIPPIFKKFT